MFRRIMIPVLVFLALMAIAAGAVYWVYDGYMYYRTDDAQVSGQVLNITAPAAGTLTSFTATVGEDVTADQVIGTITMAPAVSAGPAAAPVKVNVISPISGKVVQVPAVQGQAVAPGLQLVTVSNLSLDALTITAYVDENAINNIGTNQAVDIHIDAYGDTSFSGHVEQIVQATAGQFSLLPNQDPTSGNFTKVGQRIPVIISLDSKNNKDIVPGMSAEVVIHLH